MRRVHLTRNFPTIHIHNAWTSGLVCRSNGSTEICSKYLAFLQMNQSIKEKEESSGETKIEKKMDTVAWDRVLHASVLIGSLELFNWFLPQSSTASTILLDPAVASAKDFTVDWKRGTWWGGWAVGRSRAKGKQEKEKITIKMIR